MKRESRVQKLTPKTAEAGTSYNMTPSGSHQGSPALYSYKEQSARDGRHSSSLERLGSLLHDWLETIGYRRIFPDTAQTPSDDALPFSGNQLREIDLRITHLKNKASLSSKPADPILLDNVDLMKLLHISSRTSRLWREKAWIRYSRVGRKIYFRLEDVEQMIERGRVGK